MVKHVVDLLFLEMVVRSMGFDFEIGFEVID